MILNLDWSSWKYIVYKLLAYRYLNKLNELGRCCDTQISNLAVTLALKFKVAVYHTCNLDLSIHVCICVHRCTELWLWICQSHIWLLVCGCIHTHVNFKLDNIRLIFMRLQIYQTMVEGTLILRQSSVNGCLVCLLKCFHVKVVDLLACFYGHLKVLLYILYMKLTILQEIIMYNRPQYVSVWDPITQ